MGKTENNNKMSRCRSCDIIIDVVAMKQIDGKWVVEDFCEGCLNEYVYGANNLDDKWVSHEHLTDLRYKGFTKSPRD